MKGALQWETGLFGDPDTGIPSHGSVHPLGDTGVHILDEPENCPCKPVRDDDADIPLYVHNAFDGREDIEQGKRKPS